MDDSVSQEGFKSLDNNTNRAPFEEYNEKRNCRIPLGMDSFDAESRERFGNNVRVSMSFMDGSAIAHKSDNSE